MALFDLDFMSRYLGNNQHVSVLIPDCPEDMEPEEFYTSGKKYRVLYLLHGTFGDHSDWVRKSMIEIYAREAGVVCVMPSGLNADYRNWDGFGTGYRMEDYLVKELMPLVTNYFPVSAKRGDTFIAGLSMGAFGALSYALRYPERFAGAAMLSGTPFDPMTIDWKAYEEGRLAESSGPLMGQRLVNQIDNAGGREAYIADCNWTRFFRAFEEKKDLPALYFCIGDRDFLYPPYKRFEKAVLEKGLPVRFHEIPGLAHEWRFWDKEIDNTFDVFGLRHCD